MRQRAFEREHATEPPFVSDRWRVAPDHASLARPLGQGWPSGSPHLGWTVSYGPECLPPGLVCLQEPTVASTTMSW
jgi:hypothetical protein